MAWALNDQPLKQPALLDEFFLINGKALYLASGFESMCRYVLRVINMTKYFGAGGDISDAEALAAVLKAKLLGPTIKDMKGLPDFDVSDVALLERAKDARNFVAHESANLGWPLSSASARHIHESLARLRVEIDALVAGDNLISGWVFGIENKEPAPKEIHRAYPQRIRRWIFGAIDSGQIQEASEDRKPSR